jgi:hypothetical protein
LRDFATAIERLAYRAYPTLPEEHTRREAGCAFVDGVGDADIRIKLLLGGEKTVNEALRQALELQAVSLAARPQNNSAVKDKFRKFVILRTGIANLVWPRHSSGG